jgi:RimJ/RimL family protein N-acetyltransferase
MKKQIKRIFVNEFYKYFRGRAIIYDYGNINTLNKLLHTCVVNDNVEERRKEFMIQCYLDIEFFNFLPLKLRYQYTQVLVTFELIEILEDNSNGGIIYNFIPWIQFIDDPYDYNQLENFILQVPELTFGHLANYGVFCRNYTWEYLKRVVLLANINIDNFLHFGLSKNSTPSKYSGCKVELIRLKYINQQSILYFFADNDYPIQETLINDYFFGLNLYTFWFEIKDYESNLIGYIRLYNSNCFFDGGVFIEYIIKKSFRGQGYASNAVKTMIEFLKNYSYFLSVNAEAYSEESKRILGKNNFELLDTQFNLGYANLTHSLDLMKSRFGRDLVI